MFSFKKTEQEIIKKCSRTLKANTSKLMDMLKAAEVCSDAQEAEDQLKKKRSSDSIEQFEASGTRYEQSARTLGGVKYAIID